MNETENLEVSGIPPGIPYIFAQIKEMTNALFLRHAGNLHEAGESESGIRAERGQKSHTRTSITDLRRRRASVIKCSREVFRWNTR